MAMHERDDPEAASAPLIFGGLDFLLTSLQGVTPRSNFRPSDPIEAAHASALPTGMRDEVPDDADGMEEPVPFAKLDAHRPVTAIDAGVVSLGQTANGVVGAARAAAVTHHPSGRVELGTYRTGPFLITTQNRLALFHQMGAALGREDFYVELEGGIPVSEKVRLAVHDHRLLNRVCNYLERLVQRQVCSELVDGIVLLDGALVLRTYDTPERFMRDLHDTCSERQLCLAAVAKTTGLTIRGTDIRLLLEQEGGLPRRRKLTRALRNDPDRRRGDRALGDVYVARFAANGATYRVDVDPDPGVTSPQALDEVFSSCRFRSGYPEPLIEAHAFSYMPPPVVAQLQAHVIANYELIVHPEPNLGPVFAPFGGRYKQ